VFQSYALFPHLSVAESVVFGLRVRRVPSAERARRLARVAELLGLEQLLERKPSQLSGGQQQRVALGRAIIAEKPVCLMDEPLSNLDAQLRVEMRREIRALQQKLGMTMVYVTHDQTEAMTMADQVVLLRSGRVEQDAPPAELYARPATAFAARFIGTPPMNLLRPASSPGHLVGVRPEVVRIVDGYAEQFSKEHPSIRVKPVYTGTYQESIVKALTAYRSGEPPTTAILLSTDMFTLIDEDAIVPWDELAKAADEAAWMKAFFPAFMKNSQTGGKTWGIPFQRSTIVLYWNKEIFKEAGLDPNK